MRAADRLLDVIGCDGDIRLHLPIAKFPMRYLVDSQALIYFQKCEMEFRTAAKRRGETRILDLIPKSFTNWALTGKLIFVRWG